LDSAVFWFYAFHQEEKGDGSSWVCAGDVINGVLTKWLYPIAGPFLSDEKFCYALPPSEAQRSLSNFHMNYFFFSDILANSKWG